MHFLRHLQKYVQARCSVCKHTWTCKLFVLFIQNAQIRRSYQLTDCLNYLRVRRPIHQLSQSRLQHELQAQSLQAGLYLVSTKSAKGSHKLPQTAQTRFWITLQGRLKHCGNFRSAVTWAVREAEREITALHNNLCFHSCLQTCWTDGTGNATPTAPTSSAVWSIASRCCSISKLRRSATGHAVCVAMVTAASASGVRLHLIYFLRFPALLRCQMMNCRKVTVRSPLH